MSGAMVVALLAIGTAAAMKIVGIGGQKWAYARLILALGGGLFLLGTSVLGWLSSFSNVLGATIGLIAGFLATVIAVLFVVKDFKEDGKGDWRSIVCGSLAPVLVAAFLAPALNRIQSEADQLPQNVQRMLNGSASQTFDQLDE